MKKYLDKIPADVKGLIARAHKISCARRLPMYLVGGFVRDLLLGVRNLDVDIVVEGDAIECARLYASAYKAHVVSHARFGTATVTIGRHTKVDFATARKERYPKPACLPLVTPSSLRDDLARRDFTINAMAIGIGCADYGMLMDFCNGREDLAKGRVRVLHAASFIDDPTRILRAVRFETRYSFSLEKETLQFLRDAVSLKMLEKVQPQRTRDELVLLLKEKKAVPALRRLRALAGFAFIDRKLGVASQGLRLCAVLAPHLRWFQKVHGTRRPLDSWVIYAMALCDGLTGAQVKALCARFMFLKGEQKRMLEYKALRRVCVTALSKEAIAPSKVYAYLEPLSYETILMMRAKFHGLLLRRRIGEFLAHYNGARIHIGGRDLQRMGLAPGRRYQEILQAVLYARIDGKVGTAQEELRLAKHMVQARKG